MRSGKSRYFLAALSAAIIWGFFALPLRALKAYPAEQILHFRIIFSLVITWLMILFFRRRKVVADLYFLKTASSEQKKKLGLLTLVAGFLITGNWYSFIYAINNVSIKSAAFAYMICPLITALGGFLLLKEKATAYKLAGVGLAIVSIILLAAGSFHEVLWAIFIAALYAFYLIIQRLIPEIDKLNMLGIQLIISVIIMGPLFIYHNYDTPVELRFWIYILIISLIFTVLPLFLSLYALIGLDSSTMGILIYINPIVAFSVAFIYFNEQVSSLQVFSYSLLLVAVVVFNWGFIRATVERCKKNNF